MISQDKSAEHLQAFLDSNNYDFPVQFIHGFWAFEDIPPGSPVYIIMPSTYIIGRDGIIRYKHIGSANWKSPEMLGFISSLIEAE